MFNYLWQQRVHCYISLQKATEKCITFIKIISYATEVHVSTEGDYGYNLYKLSKQRELLLHKWTEGNCNMNDATESA